MPRATLEDLYRVHQKTELVRGELVLLPPDGDSPSRASGAIVVRLRQCERAGGRGRAYTGNAGFRVRLPHRESFSSDAAYYIGPRSGGKFLEGAPIFAAEVRSESDYGEKAEKAMAEKRADSFAAGTAVVWDVDVLREEVVRVYRSTASDRPQVYRRGDSAEAEPAVPGFRMPVEELFE